MCPAAPPRAPRPYALNNLHSGSVGNRRRSTSFKTSSSMASDGRPLGTKIKTSNGEPDKRPSSSTRRPAMPELRLLDAAEGAQQEDAII